MCVCVCVCVCFVCVFFLNSVCVCFVCGVFFSNSVIPPPVIKAKSISIPITSTF